MICPYNRKTLRQTYKQTNDLVSEDSGINKGQVCVLNEEYSLMECQKENCGAWHDGKCNYNQGGNG